MLHCQKLNFVILNVKKIEKSKNVLAYTRNQGSIFHFFNTRTHSSVADLHKKPHAEKMTTFYDYYRCALFANTDIKNFFNIIFPAIFVFILHVVCNISQQIFVCDIQVF